MNSRSSSLLVLVMLLAACGHSAAFTPTNLPPRALEPRSPETVELHLSQLPDRPYVEVGILNSGHDSAFSLSSTNEVILALRDKAAEIGCDGVLVLDETKKVFAQGGAGMASTTTISGFRAACIMYRQEQP